MSSIRSRGTALVLVGVVVFGLLASAGVSRAGEHGRCTTAVVQEPFALPDGSRADAGQLTLCTSVRYSPVSWLHKTYVNGRVVGMHESRHGTSEGLPAHGKPLVMLYRDADGLLHLQGYAIPRGEQMVTYRLDLARVKAERRLARRRGPVKQVAAPSTLFLAARLD